MSDTAIQKNIKAILAHGNETRAMVRELEEKSKQVDQLRLEVAELRRQVRTLYGRLR